MLSEPSRDRSATAQQYSGSGGGGGTKEVKESRKANTVQMASQQQEAAVLPASTAVGGAAVPASASVDGDADVDIGVDFHRDNNVGICDNCLQPFSGKELKEHVAHCGADMWSCTVCGVSVSLLRKEEHLQTHDSDRQTSCSLCGDRIELGEGASHAASCMFRRVPCQWCRTMVSHIEQHTHEMTCGSESAACHICDRTVMKRLMPRHLTSNCEFPNPTAPPEELIQLALEDDVGVEGGAGDGAGDSGAADAATAAENMSRTGKADVFLTAYSDSDDDDDDGYDPSAHATPRLMVVNGSPCQYCRIVQTAEFLKEHERLCIVLMESQGLGKRSSNGGGASSSSDMPGSAGSNRGMFARATLLPAVGYAPAPEALTKLHTPSDLIGIIADTDGSAATALTSTTTLGRTSTPPRPPDGPRRPGSGSVLGPNAGPNAGSKVPMRPSSRRSNTRGGGSGGGDRGRPGSGSSLGRSSLGSRGSGGGSGSRTNSRTNSPAPSSGGDDSDGSGAGAAEPASGAYTDKELSAIAAGKTSTGKKSLFGKLKISESSPLAASKRPKPGRPPGAPRGPSRAGIGAGAGAGTKGGRPKRPTGASPAPGAARRTPAPPPGRGGAGDGAGGNTVDLGLSLTSTAIRPT